MQHALCHYFFAIVFAAVVAAVASTSTASISENCNLFVAHNGSDQNGCGTVETPCGTLAQAVAAAKEGAVICVWAFEGAYELESAIVTNKSLHFQSLNGKAVVDCWGHGSAFQIRNSGFSTFVGFEIMNCRIDGAGAAISFQNVPSIRVEDCRFINNSASGISSDGGAISVSSGIAYPGVCEMVFLNNTFINNSASSGGAVLFIMDANIQMQFEGNTLTGNSGNSGGTLCLQVRGSGFVSAFLRENKFVNNSAANGGAVYFYPQPAGPGHPSLLLGSNEFKGNYATARGGAFYFYDFFYMNQGFNQGLLSLIGNNFSDNRALGDGGGISLVPLGLFDGTFIVKNNWMARNSAAKGGGLALNAGGMIQGVSFQLQDNVIQENRAVSGAGVSISIGGGKDNAVHIVGDQYANNSATGENGGAVSVTLPPDVPVLNVPHLRSWTYVNEVSFHGVNFLGNSACGACLGGAVYLNQGQATLNDCAFERNNGSLGASIYVGGPSTALALTNCTFSRSIASVAGDDIYSISSGELLVNGSLFDVDYSTPICGGGGTTFFRSTNGGKIVFTEADVHCSTGIGFSNDTTSWQTSIPPWGQVTITSVNLRCAPCPAGTYSFGNVSLGESQQNTCYECPALATCVEGEAYPGLGFWCGPQEDDPRKLGCGKCPEGYCKEEADLRWNRDLHRVS